MFTVLNKNMKIIELQMSSILSAKHFSELRLKKNIYII